MAVVMLSGTIGSAGLATDVRRRNVAPYRNPVQCEEKERWLDPSLLPERVKHGPENMRGYDTGRGQMRFGRRMNRRIC